MELFMLFVIIIEEFIEFALLTLFVIFGFEEELGLNYEK